jgi:hypothetical protein
VGHSIQLPVTDGKKSASVRIEAQVRENIKINNRAMPAVRYEAFVFNDVIFKRNARLLIWLSDDSRALPLQIVVRSSLPVGAITLTLDKAIAQ